MPVLKGKFRRLAAVTAAAALAALQLTVSAPMAAPCIVAGHSMTSGTVIKVDVRGDAWTAGSKVPGPVRELACAGGRWVPGGAR